MPAIAPVPPNILKDVLVEAGWAIFDEDSYNWLLMKNGVPLALPKHGGVVSLEIHEKCLERCQIDAR